jgi:hypothetical protein
MHLLATLLLSGCGSAPPAPPPPPSGQGLKAKAKATKATKASKAAPVVKPPDPDLSGIPAKPGEMVGCPPGTVYTFTESPEGNAAWCDKDGKKHGNYRLLYPDGTDREKGGYLDGQEDGLWTSFHPGGTARESRGTWNHGKRIGTWVYWAPSGKLAQEGDYLNGRRAGVWTEYDALGRTWKEGMYVNDSKDGNWTIYRPSEEGVIDHLERWERGNLIGEAPPPILAPAPAR